jgi:hypothetical protein
MGMKTDGLDDTQLVNNLQSLFQIDAAKKLKGAISDKEEALLGRTTFNLDNLPEVNQRILDAQSAAYQRAKQKGVMANDYLKTHDRLDRNFESQWDAYMNANPLFTADEMTNGRVGPPQAAAKPTQTFKTKNGVNWSY